MPLNRITPNNATNDTLVNLTSINGEELKKVSKCVDTANNRLKVDIEDASGQGLATEAKQDDQITKLTEIDTAIDSMNSKITIGDDDTLLTAQQVCIYGRKDPAVSGLRAVKVQDDGTMETTDTSLNGKITAGNDDSITGSLQQNLIYARFDNDGTLKAVKCSSDGSVITAPAGGTIITTDGTTSEQRVMILGNHNGNLRTIACGEGGQIQTELDYSWDNTNEIFTNEPVADAATITSATFDLGQGVAHDLGNVEFFHTNSNSVLINIIAEVSPDGTNWYSLDGASFSASKQYVSHNQEEVGISIGHRYMRLVIENQDGTGTSTNITTKIAYYK